jgi:sugar-specific transcriptional regulator TrmB
VVKLVKGIEFQKALETLGLTIYEAKAYICLVEKGTSSAGELSKVTEIPHSKIYEVLIRLEKKKLVEIQKSRPLFFRAIKPSTAIQGLKIDAKEKLEQELNQRKNSLEENYTRKIQEITEANKALDDLESLYERNEALQPSEEFIWTIRGKSNINNEAKGLILSARKAVRLMVPQDDFSELESAIKTAASKNVKVSMVIHEDTASVQKLKENTEVFCDASPSPTNCGMIMADDKAGIFISENFLVGFKTSSKSLLMVLAQFYGHELEESVKLKR